MFKNTAFHSAQEMIREGYCRTRQGELLEIKPEYRIGIPDEDMALTYDETRRLLGAIKDERDWVIFGLMFRTGARVTQNMNAYAAYLDFVKGRIWMPPAKFGDPFYRNLDDLFLERAAHYIEEYRIRPSEHLFCIKYEGGSQNPAGFYHKDKTPLSRKDIQQLIDRYAKRAGLQYKYVDLRTGELRNRVHCHTAKITVVSWIYAICKDSLMAARAVGNRTSSICEKHYIKINPTIKNEVVAQALSPLTQPDKSMEHELRQIFEEEMAAKRTYAAGSTAIGLRQVLSAVV